MSLKNTMEEKKLNFNRPFLSVRRFASTVSTSETENKRKSDVLLPQLPRLPVYKSELKSGPVRNPGNVPFVWEQTPGRPKDGSKLPSHAPEKPPVAPKLPPGRILNVKLQNSDRGPKNVVASGSRSGNNDSCCQNIQSLDANVGKEESSKEKKKEMGSSGSDDSDEAYVDAVDTLSRSESFFYNCSLSGVSGLDGPELKSSETFAMDTQMQEFMMGRFLPAAKAVASENPHYSTKKQRVAQQQPRKINNEVISAERRQALGPNILNSAPYHGLSSRVEESEDEDSDHGESDNSSPNVFGLFPRLCLGNSICLLNPVPGTRKQAQPPVSSVRRTKVKSSYAGCCVETEIKHDKSAVYKPRSTDRLQPTGLHGHRTELKSASDQITCMRDSKKGDGSPLHKSWQDKGASPSHIAASRNAIREERKFLGIPKISKHSEVKSPSPRAKHTYNFLELLAIESNKWESGSASPAERTLYIDSVHTVKPQSSNSSSSDMKLNAYNGKDDGETLAKASEIEETASIDSPIKDIKQLDAVGEKAEVWSGSLGSVGSGFLSSDRSIHDVQMDVVECSKTDQALTQACITFTSLKVEKDRKIASQSHLDMEECNLESSRGLVHDSIAFKSAKLGDAGKNDVKSQLGAKPSNHETSPGTYPPLPPPPPLPKSPSESWLRRALPTVSSRTSYSNSYLGMHGYPRLHASKTQSFDPKWEATVKSSNVQSGNLSISEELLAPIPEA